MRNGQELGALLGYQLERGLHENHPGVELDEFIYVLRDRFPFVSRKLTPVPDGTAAEVIEARNVINGYDFLEHIRGKTYPYGIAGLPPRPAEATRSSPRSTRSTTRSMRVADLMLAESVHQVVSRNYDRARGVLQAMGEASAAAARRRRDAAQRARLLQRVAIFAAGGAGWTGNPPTGPPPLPIRGSTPGWSRCCRPSAIAVRATAGGAPSSFLTLAALTSMRSTRADDRRDARRVSTELERCLADHAARPRHRRRQPVTIDPTAAPAVAQPLAPLLPLLRALRGSSSARASMPAITVSPARAIGPTPPIRAASMADGAAARSAGPPARARPPTPPSMRRQCAPARARGPGTDRRLTALEADPRRSTARLDAASGVLAPALGRRPPRRARSAAARAPPAPACAAVKRLVQQARNLARLAPSAARWPSRSRRRRRSRCRRRSGRGGRARGRGSTNRALRSARRSRRCSATRWWRCRCSARRDHAPRWSAPPPSGENRSARIETWLQSLSRVRTRWPTSPGSCGYREWTARNPGSLTPSSCRCAPAIRGSAAPPARRAARARSCSVVASTRRPIPAPTRGPAARRLDRDVPTDKETTGIAFHFDRPNAAPPQALLLAVPPALRRALALE